MPGDPDYGPAGCSEALIAKAVLLEGGNRAVDAAAVGFDDQTRVSPDEVGHQRDAID
jgi:hypothetical protein